MREHAERRQTTPAKQEIVRMSSNAYAGVCVCVCAKYNSKVETCPLTL